MKRSESKSSGKMAALAIIGAMVLLAGVGLWRHYAGTPEPTVGEQPKSPVHSTTPEAAVKGFIVSLNAGELEAAARFYEGGDNYWRNMPDMWKSMINQFMGQGKEITSYEIGEADIRGDMATIVLSYHVDHGQYRYVATLNLIKRPEGWLLVKILG